jgi:hypothetical protein
MGQFIATVILLEAAPSAFANIGYRFWIILICLTFLYGVLVYFFLPEVRPSKIPSEDAVLTKDVDKRDDPRGH